MHISQVNEYMTHMCRLTDNLVGCRLTDSIIHPNCRLTDTYVVGNPTQYQQKATQKSNNVAIDGMEVSSDIGFKSSEKRRV